MNWLEYFDHRDDSSVRGWRRIHVSDGDQPYQDRWWILGTSLGYEHSFIHQAADFFKGLENGGKGCLPTIEEALYTENVCNSVLRSVEHHSGTIDISIWLH